LKARATRPPAASLRGQQWKFDRFQSEYNFERPHEALDDEPPASLWIPSPRPYPDRIEPPAYPGHFELRRVSNAGHFKMGAQHYFISHALKGDNVGLEPIDDGLWNILYYTPCWAASASVPARSAGLRSARTSVNDVPGHL
jgi:putative transposase